MNEQITRTDTSASPAPAPLRRFTVRLPGTPAGARQARILACRRLADWGVPPDDARLVIAELCANAALHGSDPGRTFRLALTLTGADRLRIEVADSRPAHLPAVRRPHDTDGRSGHGLRIVQQLADTWGASSGPGHGKTVWAELGLRT
ncbi:ATP-binding protein [Streptomyces capparidis]